MFSGLKPGDQVKRVMGGAIIMLMKVEVVTEDHIFCNAVDTNFPQEEMWKFDRKTGAEEDEGLGWGVKFGITGSQLQLVAQ